MAKDHYLPAGFIGRFSGDTTSTYRDRRLWAYNSKAGKTLSTAASAIGYKKGLYNLHDGNNVDKWDYEGPLNRVLDDMAQGKEVALDDWVRIAVPFVTGLFVRGKEFNERYESMPLIKGLADKLNADNTNGSRIMRLQRQLAPVMAARWVVLHNDDPNTRVISNDLGLVLTQDVTTKEVGWAIPLDPKTILGIFPQKQRIIGQYKNGMWVADIRHLQPPAAMFKGINEQIARSSNEFIFGTTKIDVEACKQHTGVVAEEKMPIIMEAPWSQTFSGRELIAHERDWWTVSAIANLNLDPESVATHNFNLFKDATSNGKWEPPMIFFDGNLTEFPSGVAIDGETMQLNLNLLDDFENHIIKPPQDEDAKKHPGPKDTPE